MSSARSSPGPALAADDFANCGWQDALRSADPWAYSSTWGALLAAAKDAEGDDRRAKALRLLADACSMTFSPDKAVEPFGPRFSFPGGSSFSPDDLTESSTAFLASAVRAMETCAPGAHLLKARLADLVWLVQEPRSVEFALLAIDSYRAVPLTVEAWLGDGFDCWKRALRLARLCGTTIGDRRARMEASIMDAFESATVQDRFLGVELAELMRTKGLGEDRPPTIAAQLESLGREFDRTRDFWPAERYLREAGHWFKASGDESAAMAMTATRAECWVKRADERLSSADPSHGVAASFIEKAIQIYRTIPKKQRETHNGNERLSHLQTLLREFGRRAVDELARSHGQEVEIANLIRRARAAVTGKTTVEALTAFASLSPWASADELRNSAIELLRKYPISAILFPSISMSRDGRVVARNPPAHLADTPTESDEIVIRDRMLGEHRVRVGLVTQGYILPALEVLRFEHRIRESDFIELANQAAIVPPGRGLLFGKALFAGYDGDFATAVHLLVPQVEHMVRFHLSRAGVETRHLDDDGLQTEKGLNSLVALTESSDIFGLDVVFEIAFLFCEPGGANLRNLVAHGLLNDMEVVHGVYPIYAWWLTLKLVLSYFSNTVSSDTEETARADGE